MKARVATILSLTGVLVAGSAAALVNTQVLTNAAPSANSVSKLVAASDDPSTSADVVVSAPSSASSSSATSTSVAADDVKIYEVQGTGRITLDTSKDVLRIVSVEGIAPWLPLSQRQVDAQRVEIRFVNGEAVVVFAAGLTGDEVTYDLRMESLATGSSATEPSVATPPSSSTETSVSRGTSPSTPATPSSVDDSDDDDSKATTSTDDKGSGKGGGGGGGGDDDHPDDDD